MPSTTVTIDKLEISPFNVRSDKRDIDATSALEASLLAEGQLLPLIVHPMLGRRDRFGVFAGGRRLRAFRRLIERGALPADHGIDVVVRDLPPGKLIEVSTTENLIRRDLRPYEIAAAVLAAHGKGRTADQIAEALGQELLWVRRQLRLARLAPEIFAAFAAGELDMDQAAAYAATEDHDLQLAVWAELKGQSFATASAIRSRLKVGDHELDRLLRFVGAEVYRDAGGRYELDLFCADPFQRGRVVDEGVLRQLADTALAAFRDDVRRRCGRPDIRFVVQPPRNDFGTDYTLRIDAGADGDDFSLPDGEVVAHVQLSRDCRPEVSFWWASRAAKHGRRASAPADAPSPAPQAALHPEHDGGTARRAANADLRERDGVSAASVEIFRTARRAVLRALLIWDAEGGLPSVAHDLLVWGQLRIADGLPDTARRLGMVVRLGASPDPAAHDAILAAMPAIELWDSALQEVMSRPAFALEDDQDAFRAFRCESARIKRLAAAIVAGLALERSLNADGYAVPFHNAIADECDAAGDNGHVVRKLWHPDARFLGLLNSRQLLSIAEPFAQPDVIARWAKPYKSARVPAELAQLLAGTMDGGYLSPAAAVAAQAWVHPLLAFPAGTDGPAVADADAGMATGDDVLERAGE
jgi:ParB/RepB/Spo0J family partition protein